MKAVIYARFSSDNQREESIEGQVRECLAFAERKGISVIKTYADRAISGKRADNRPQFQQMILDSARCEFDAVIVWKIDRFSRDKYDNVMYKSKLNKNGVSVISATEPIDDSPEGKLMESIFEGFSEYYIKDLAQKTSRGMTENAIKGKFNGGKITYGYMIDANKSFQLDTAASPVVEEIFNRYASGENINSIVDDLHGKGLNNRGKPFTYHFVNWLLKNRRYIGEYSFNGTINTTAIPPIVSFELFEKCQIRLNENKHKSANFRKVEEKYYLTGKIFCGYCGDTMSGISGTGKNKMYRYYQCMSSKKRRCAKKIIQKDFVESKALSAAMSMFGDKKLIKKICDTCFALQSTDSAELPALKKQLKQVGKEIDNLMKAIKSGVVTKSTKAALEKLEAEQEKLEIAISQEKMKRPTISRKQIEDWIMKFAKSDLSSPKQKQKIINVFINSVYVYDDKMVLFLNYRDGERCVRFDEAVSKKTKPDTLDKCSTLVSFGDPYGN